MQIIHQLLTAKIGKINDMALNKEQKLFFTKMTRWIREQLVSEYRAERRRG